MNKQIINAAIKQSGHYADILNGVLYVSKFFQNNANYYGTTEYRKMNEILAVYPDMKIELYAPTRKKRLTYEMMEAFIRIMPDAEKNFAAYTRVRKMSVAYKSPYKFVEDWFAKQFPYYGRVSLFSYCRRTDWSMGTICCGQASLSSGSGVAVMPTTNVRPPVAASHIASRAMLAQFGSGLYVGNRTMLCASSQMMTSKFAAKSGLRLTHAPNCA